MTNNTIKAANISTALIFIILKFSANVYKKNRTFTEVNQVLWKRYLVLARKHQ